MRQRHLRADTRTEQHTRCTYVAHICSMQRDLQNQGLVNRIHFSRHLCRWNGLLHGSNVLQVAACTQSRAGVNHAVPHTQHLAHCRARTHLLISVICDAWLALSVARTIPIMVARACLRSSLSRLAKMSQLGRRMTWKQVAMCMFSRGDLSLYLTSKQVNPTQQPYFNEEPPSWQAHGTVHHVLDC